MISYKKDVLERQSLLEVKMAEALQSVKEMYCTRYCL